MLNRVLSVAGFEIRRKLSTPKGFPACLDSVEGMLSIEEAECLFDLARCVENEHCIVEVGSFRGRSTVALASGSAAGPGAPVYAVEPHEPFEGVLGGKFGPEDRGAFYRNMLDTGCYRHVRLINLSSEVVAPGWCNPVGLLWLDGDHSYEGVKRDFECWRPHLIPLAKVAFDDSINPSIGPRTLIDELVADNIVAETDQVGKVTVIELNRSV